jgi:hypothetical protein
MGSDTTPPRYGVSCASSTGAASVRDEQAIRGWKRVEWPRIKKSRARRARDHIYRRKWIERAAASGENLGARGARARFEWEYVGAMSPKEPFFALSQIAPHTSGSHGCIGDLRTSFL